MVKDKINEMIKHNNNFSFIDNENDENNYNFINIDKKRKINYDKNKMNNIRLHNQRIQKYVNSVEQKHNEMVFLMLKAIFLLLASFFSFFHFLPWKHIPCYKLRTVCCFFFD